MAIDITESTITGQGQLSGFWAASATPVRNADNDITFYVGRSPDKGLLRGIGEISGSFHTGTFILDASIVSGIGEISGSFIPPVVVDGLLSALGSISADFSIAYIRGNSVGWSKIGDTRILVDESNEAGYSPLEGPIVGSVCHILPIRKQVPVVYTTTGIHVMIPVKEPFATFGFRRIGLVGVYGPGAACGHENYHVFVNKDKDVCLISYEEGRGIPAVKVLGYSEFIEAITPADEQLVLMYDKDNDRTYISSPVGGYVLSGSGLGGGYAGLTGFDGTYTVAPATLTPLTQELCTDILDMNNRGVKTITQVSVGVDNTQDLYVAVDYRYNKKDAFKTSPWKILNNEGVAFPIVSGLEFRIRIKNLVNDQFDLDYLMIGIKFSDKRYKRGASASDTVGE